MVSASEFPASQIFLSAAQGIARQQQKPLTGDMARYSKGWQSFTSSNVPRIGQGVHVKLIPTTDRISVLRIEPRDISGRAETMSYIFEKGADGRDILKNVIQNTMEAGKTVKSTAIKDVQGFHTGNFLAALGKNIIDNPVTKRLITRLP